MVKEVEKLEGTRGIVCMDKIQIINVVAKFLEFYEKLLKKI